MREAVPLGRKRSQVPTASLHVGKIRFVRLAGFLFMGMLSLIVLVPMALMVLSSLKTPAEAARISLALPTEWIWSNYRVVIVEGKMLQGLFNSLLVTAAAVIITIGAGSMCAFVLGRRSERWSGWIYLLFMMGLIAPPIIIPTIKLMQLLHLSNQYAGLILFYAAIKFPFVIFMMTGFIKSIPRELDEAAIVDGAKGLTLFFRIMLPLLKPSIATATVFVFMLVWNDFQWPLFLLNDSTKWTIPLTVFNFVSKYGTQWQLVFADLLLSMTPVLILYIAAQRFIIEGMTAGSIKG